PGVLDASDALAFVGSPGCGGTALFVGSVRSPDGGRPIEMLEYEVWPERVGAELEAIAAEALERFGAERAWIGHRTGPVAPGEASVVVAVSSAHRAEAFDACRWAIDALKERAPIWKREVAGAETRWVANT
ncbi:MAG TPA: molybdenum cofactor biosynthesis protein MoaE, partial [Actinomycetota bacterium]|nr:molybdenum cofactor biosynthesis protein MoaE [Actinomycetota bacterium]